MATHTLSHRRIHHLLLISRLLNLRDAGASPFTLLLDTAGQGAGPLVGEFVKRAEVAKCKVVYVAWETLRVPGLGPGPGKDGAGDNAGVSVVKARGKKVEDVQQEIGEVIRSGTAGGGGRTLIILDSLHPLCAHHPTHISTFLSSLLSPTTTLLATYHLDVPLPPSTDVISKPFAYPETAPHPLTLVKYLCTTLITVHSLHHVLLLKACKDRSMLPPKWGLGEEHHAGAGGGVEGVIVGLGSNSHFPSTGRGGPCGSPEVGKFGPGIVLEFEHRRKSGRGVQEWLFLPTTSSYSSATTTKSPAGSPPARTIFEKVGAPPGAIEKITLLEDHPAWRLSEQVRMGKQDYDRDQQEEEEGPEVPQSTFNLSLTDAQKKARDNVVLPYLDAQSEFGGDGGGGGRILYMPDRVDDWDDEEDEI